MIRQKFSKIGLFKDFMWGFSDSLLSFRRNSQEGLIAQHSSGVGRSSIAIFWHNRSEIGAEGAVLGNFGHICEKSGQILQLKSTHVTLY